MEKGVDSTEQVLEELHQKYSKKRIGINIILLIILAGIVISFFFVLYSYFYSPEKVIGLGADIENVLIDDTGEIAYVNLKAGSLVNITKIKFTFSSGGSDYVYETQEGIEEVAVPYERSFTDWILRRQLEGVYEYSINLKDVSGLESFSDLEKVDVVFEYKTQTGKVVDSPILDTERTVVSHTSGGGGGGSPTPTPCVPGSWTDTIEYRCINNSREIKQTRSVCSTEASEQWISNLCYENYTCFDGENAPINLCINESQYCIDSDGLDYNINGTVNHSNIIYSDVCADSINVTEYTCYYNSTTEQTQAKTQDYECVNGCLSGACLGPACVIDSDCNDSITCTDDSCNSGNCVNTVNDGLCDDGLWCDGTEICDALLDCQAGTSPVIDDGVTCTDDSCDEVNDVVVNLLNHSFCDNGLWCDGTETCDLNLDCQSGTSQTCIDGIACTPDDVCDEINDRCDYNTLGCSCSTEGPAPIACDDSNSCTDDVCTALLTCQNTNNDANSCDQGLLCTENDVCSAGSCTADPVDPDDSISCTIDSCDEVSGVTNIANSGLCDDGDVCTENICALTGCEFPFNIAGCDDGITCTENDVCSLGSCAGIVNDGLCLTSEYCDVALDCQERTCSSCADCELFWGIGCDYDKCKNDCPSCYYDPVLGQEDCVDFNEFCGASGRISVCDDYSELECLGNACGIVGGCEFSGGSCVVAQTCFDLEQNQGESDIDCGGVCIGCDLGENCFGGSDCLSNNCSLGVCSEGSVLIPDDYVGYWKFDGDTNDSSPFENDGIWMGAGPAIYSVGQFWQALEFDGENGDYVNIGNSDSLNQDFSQITMVFWFNAAKSNDFHEVLGKDSIWWVRILESSTDYIRFGHNNIGDGYSQITIGNEIAPYEWNHYAVTYNGTNTGIYFNGVYKGGEAATGTTGLDSTSGAIGRYRASTSGQPATGKIDEVMIFNRSLSEEEILQIYNVQYGCQINEQCDDGNDCTNNTCVGIGGAGADSIGCVFENKEAGSVCEDGLFCTIIDTSSCDGNGNCQGGNAVDCSDGVACTNDSCIEGAGSCIHSINNSNCNFPEQICDINLDCISNPCDVVDDCSYYDLLGEVACNDDVCVPEGCSWNLSLSVCSEIPLLESYLAYWKFDEEVGGITPDEKGVNNGTLIGDASIIFDSRRGDVLGLDESFDWGDDYVDIGTNLPNIGTNDFTLSAWVKIRNNNLMGNMPVITKGEYYDGGEILFYKNEKADRFNCFGADIGFYPDGDDPNLLISMWSDNGWISDPSDLLSEEWNHIACTRNSSSATLYINGVVATWDYGGVLVHTDTSVSGVNLTNTDNWLIGKGYGRPFMGRIDDVMIYNKGLSKEEMLQLYNLQNECQEDVLCDDGRVCTTNTCVGIGGAGADSRGCAVENKGATTPCDDGLYCTITETCDGLGNCTGETFVNCNDGKTCTTDVCREGKYSFVSRACEVWGDGTDICSYPQEYDSYVCENWGDNNDCNPGEICDAVQDCISDPCSGIDVCSYYVGDAAGCDADTCVPGGCEWSSGTCESASSLSLGYEGFGTVTRGALDCPGYEVYHVTSLADDGSLGTFRDAVSEGCRYIVFDVGGTIALTSSIIIDYLGYLTIDGSTAPSPGITLLSEESNSPGYYYGFKVLSGGHDIIINNIRGDGGYTGPNTNSGDMWALDTVVHGSSSPPIYNVIVDHCTFTSAADGVIDTRGKIENVTYSWNLFKDTERMGSFSDEGYRKGISFHHNVLAHGGERMPKVKNEGSITTDFDLVNNIIYGWGTWKYTLRPSNSVNVGHNEGLRMGIASSQYELHVTNNWYEAFGGTPEWAIAGPVSGDDGFARIDFEGNVFPGEEDDDVDTAFLPPDIPLWAQVTTYDANDLGSDVVPYAGTHYKTVEELDLLNEISGVIGGIPGEDKVLLISLDGLQLNHFNEMLAIPGQLPNFESIISGGFNDWANISHHLYTSTGPGHAEMLSGFGDEITGVVDNNNHILPDGLSVFERIENFNSAIVTGSIWGKDKTYVPESLLTNTRPEIDWWQDFSLWDQEQWEDRSEYATADSVANKAVEFINQYSDNSFFFFVHFQDTDAAGHKYNESSVEYSQAVLDMDAGLGILLNALQAQGIEDSTEIIILADHGFEEGGYYHGDGTDINNRVVPLMSNNPLLVSEITSNGEREQCEVVPTILDYFGIDISDLEAYGCDSMMDSGLGSQSLWGQITSFFKALVGIEEPSIGLTGQVVGSVEASEPESFSTNIIGIGNSVKNLDSIELIGFRKEVQIAAEYLLNELLGLDVSVKSITIGYVVKDTEDEEEITIGF